MKKPRPSRSSWPKMTNFRWESFAYCCKPPWLAPSGAGGPRPPPLGGNWLGPGLSSSQSPGRVALFGRAWRRSDNCQLILSKKKLKLADNCQTLSKPTQKVPSFWHFGLRILSPGSKEVFWSKWPILTGWRLPAGPGNQLPWNSLRAVVLALHFRCINSFV